MSTVTVKTFVRSSFAARGLTNRIHDVAEFGDVVDPHKNGVVRCCSIPKRWRGVLAVALSVPGDVNHRSEEPRRLTWPTRASNAMYGKECHSLDGVRRGTTPPNMHRRRRVPPLRGRSAPPTSRAAQDRGGSRSRVGGVKIPHRARSQVRDSVTKPTYLTRKSRVGIGDRAARNVRD